jgi:hypothetical protein
MVPSLLLALTLSPGVDVFGGARSEPLGPKAYPPVYAPAEAPAGYLYQPAVDLHPVPRMPVERYCPKLGDVLLLSDPDPLFNVLYVIARSGKPGHSAVVVTMPDGKPGVLEAGFSFTPWVRVTPLDYWINLYAGHVWVRQREVPLTPDQDRRLTEFAGQAADHRYHFRKFSLQLTLFRTRNPFVTPFAGKPVGPGHQYTCVQIVMESLVYAGLVDPATARPDATYAQDLFYDRSRNPYIDRHPPMAGRGWGEPKLWTPIPGTANRGSNRPHPPAPWPGPGAAIVLNPVQLNGPQQPPTPVVTETVPGTAPPLPEVEPNPARIGFLDRPTRLFSRRR